MLANAVESATRSPANINTENLSKLIDQIVLKKFTQEQFEDCDITQADLAKIREAFVKHLKKSLDRRNRRPSLPPC